MSTALRAPALGLLAAIAACFAFISAASAASLTADQAKRFALTMPALKAIGDRLEAEGALSKMEPSDMIVNGQFKPYSATLGKIRAEKPSAVKEVTKAVKANGFSSVDQWAGIGDRVMVTYMLIKNPRMATMQVPDQMPDMSQMPANVPPEMEAMIRERMKAMANNMGPMKAMANTVKTVTPQERAAVEPIVPLLDEHMEDQPMGGPSGPGAMPR